ncbi:hypothetical protein EHS39_36215 [Ensifer sp. MPMI2T]|nr:hypothetical protein EHS39_36215 [Ensifer sp. MPMI2T]
MASYFVTWEIDVFDAASPEEAARIAHEMVRRPDTTATVYKVIEHDAADAVTVDLSELDNPAVHA